MVPLKECAEMTCESKRYNGWANYETWCVNLWISNDQGMYEEWGGRAADALGEAREGNDDMQSAIGDAANDIANALKSEISDMAPECGGLFADLLTGALGEVDWYEIAEMWVKEHVK